MNLPSSITLCEVGLRDGLQNEATLLTVHQKVALLLGLIDAGFKVIEVGSFMHPKAVPNQVYDLCSHVRSAFPECSWWLHFHNTRGMAMVNILSALEAGMTRFDSSFVHLFPEQPETSPRKMSFICARNPESRPESTSQK